MTALEPGLLLTPALCLTRRLGVGGMGTIWIARHLALGTDVAVKVIADELTGDVDAIARFQREAAAAAEVRSPHVVQVFDYGVAECGVPYIAMELLEGEDLGARIARQRTMSPGEVAGVVVQVARALSRAHERRIVHRDIKPENIFLCETGDDELFVKVLDFGIAKTEKGKLPSGTQTGAMMGTPFFMSPEQVRGHKSIDPRADLWSLGVVAFLAMTGKRPFDGDTIGAISVAICDGELPRASTLNPRLPPGIDAWFATACAVDPAARFPTARAMADALVAAVGGPELARIRPRGAPEPAREPAQSPATQLVSTSEKSRTGVASSRPWSRALSGVAGLLAVVAASFVATSAMRGNGQAPTNVDSVATTQGAPMVASSPAALPPPVGPVAPVASSAPSTSVVAAPPSVKAPPVTPPRARAVVPSAKPAPPPIKKPKQDDEPLE